MVRLRHSVSVYIPKTAWEKVTEISTDVVKKKREKENRVSRINRYTTVERKDVISLKVTRLTSVYKDFGQTWSIFVHVYCVQY